MVVDWQNDPIKDNLLHVDLKRIDLTKRISCRSRCVTQGEPKGRQGAGRPARTRHARSEIECLPDEIPENFTLDVRELMMGQSVRAADIALAGIASS